MFELITCHLSLHLHLRSSSSFIRLPIPKTPPDPPSLPPSPFDKRSAAESAHPTVTDDGGFSLTSRKCWKHRFETSRCLFLVAEESRQFEKKRWNLCELYGGAYFERSEIKPEFLFQTFNGNKFDSQPWQSYFADLTVVHRCVLQRLIHKAQKFMLDE